MADKLTFIDNELARLRKTGLYNAARGIGSAQGAWIIADGRRVLDDEGIFAQAIGFPTVPEGKARIRCMVSAVHTKADLDFAVEKFEKVR